MISNLNALPIDERIQLVKDLWGSIAQENMSIPISQDQKNELDLRLKAYSLDKKKEGMQSLSLQILEIHCELSVNISSRSRNGFRKIS